MMSSLTKFMLALYLASPLNTSPVTLGGVVALSALIMMGLMLLQISSMLPMLIFLIYIGGLMVMFSYFLASNPNTLTPVFLAMASIPTNIFLLFLCSNTPSPFNQTPHALPISSSLYLGNTDILVSLTLILLLALVVTASMAAMNYAPMRPQLLTF